MDPTLEKFPSLGYTASLENTQFFSKRSYRVSETPENVFVFFSVIVVEKVARIVSVETKC